MRITLHSTLLLTLFFCAFGCQRTPPLKKLFFDDLRLGMPSADATKVIGREGKACDYDKLPIPPELYKGIPESTTWLVWWQEKDGVPLRAELILGVLDGRVIYKEVQYEEDGQMKVERRVLPEFQDKK